LGWHSGEENTKSGKKGRGHASTYTGRTNQKTAEKKGERSPEKEEEEGGEERNGTASNITKNARVWV